MLAIAGLVLNEAHAWAVVDERYGGNCITALSLSAFVLTGPLKDHPHILGAGFFGVVNDLAGGAGRVLIAALPLRLDRLAAIKQRKFIVRWQFG